jgi:hypothetical protein
MFLMLKYLPGGMRTLQSQPTTQQLTEWQDRAGEDVWVQVTNCGGITAAVVALVFSVVGLVRTRRHPNWPAIVGVGLSGVFLGVMCAGMLVMLGSVAARGG